ncbi:hypothetical protein D3C78_1366500 [compost metagenome]
MRWHGSPVSIGVAVERARWSRCSSAPTKPWLAVSSRKAAFPWWWRTIRRSSSRCWSCRASRVRRTTASSSRCASMCGRRCSVRPRVKWSRCSATTWRPAWRSRSPCAATTCRTSGRRRCSPRRRSSSPRWRRRTSTSASICASCPSSPSMARMPATSMTRCMPRRSRAPAGACSSPSPTYRTT